ncbi:MAG: DNA-directed RNA polymerase subunit alpha [Candidatus Dojkabacteria bacterium]|nr:DNA-directed RNA polymerase subunit alpha [Candidatus Dojkabacteria bacterium]
MIDLKLLKIIEKPNDDYGFDSVFEIGPLPKGFGDTFGVPLRRILLSSIPGSAITAIKINGLYHEFTTLAGLSDDILTVILSLKNVVVKLKTLESQTLNIEVKGKDGVAIPVKAGDFEENPFVDIVNKDYVITYITGSDSIFKAQIFVERGVGFKMSSSEVRSEIGKIPVDARFSPVTFVHYAITNTRVGQETELDQLNIHIKTNGIITSREALNLAIEILGDGTNHIKNVANNLLNGNEISIKLYNQSKHSNEKSVKVTNTTNVLVQQSKVDDSNIPSTKIVDLKLSTRLTNVLLKAGITDLKQCNGMTREELANIRGLGSKTLEEFINVLEKHSINLL